MLFIKRLQCANGFKAGITFRTEKSLSYQKIPNFGIDNSARVGNIMGGLFRNCQRGLNHFQKETSSLIEISENQIMKLRCKNYHSENCTFVGTFSCIFSIMALILNALLNSGAWHTFQNRMALFWTKTILNLLFFHKVTKYQIHIFLL